LYQESIFPESGRGLGYVAPTISIHFVGVRWPEKVCGISNGHAIDDVTWPPKVLVRQYSRLS